MKDIFTTFAVASIVVGLLVLVGYFTWVNDSNNMPAALDVYRGKTTLEITYRDSVAVDSVVVYK